MSCSRNYGISHYPPCSGHATSCINNQCICESGWSSYGDFQFSPGYDCDINIKVIQIWSIINMILTGVVFMTIGYNIFKERALSVEKRYTARTCCYFSILAVNIAGMIRLTLKAIDPVKYVLGHGYLLAMMDVIVVTGVSSTGSAYVNILVRFLQGYSRLLDYKRRRHFSSVATVVSKIIFVAPILLGVMILAVFIACNFFPDSSSDSFAIMYFGSLGFFYLAYSIVIEYVIYVFVQEVQSFLNSKENTTTILPYSLKRSVEPQYSSIQTDLKSVYSKIVMSNRLLLPFLIHGTLLNLSFMGWIFLRRKLSYLIELEFTFLAILGPVFMNSITTISKPSNTRNLAKVIPENRNTNTRIITVTKKTLVPKVVQVPGSI